MLKVTKKFTPRPRAIQGDLAQLPEALQPLTRVPQWVCWCFRRKASGNGWTKPPVSAHGGPASSTDPSTWSTYEEAVAYVKSGRADGIGFVLTPDLSYAAIDVDGCRYPDLKYLAEWGQDFLEQAVRCETYAEVTPSGEGIRIWGLTEAETRSHVPYKLGLEGSGHKCQIELYRRTNQYVTITGADITAASQLGNIDRVFDWAPRWAARHPRSTQPVNGSGTAPGHGPVVDLTVDEIDRLVAEGVPEGSADRSQLFHGICWHFAGYGYGIEQIADMFEDHPGGIAQRYVQEGRLLIREVARCLRDHNELGAEARQILAETEGKRAEKPAQKPTQSAKTNGHGKPEPESEPERESNPKLDSSQIPPLEAMRDELLDLGFTDEEIDRMTPEGAWKRLGHTIQEPVQDDFPADDGGDWGEDDEENEEDDDESDIIRIRPKKNPKDDAELVVIDAGVDESLPPPRAWLMANQFCRGFVSSLIAPGGVGKTTLRLAQYIALATGREITGQKVFTRCRVLVLSFEDDENELRRRIHAICKTYEIPISELQSWLFYSCPKKRLKLATMDPRQGPAIGQLEEKVRKQIQAKHIDLVGFDPLVKVHAISENDNTGMDFVVGLLTELAIDYKIAVDAPHHSRKGALSPGDADSGRGASAIVDAGRLNYTLTPMTDEEMEKFPEIKPEDDRLFVRLDPAKVNILKKSRLAIWFELIDVPLGNGNALYPEGDHVQSIKPFKAQAIGTAVSDEIKEEILTVIERGLIDPATGQPTGQRYTAAKGNVKERAAWRVVAQFVPELTEAACQEWINDQLGKTLESRPYVDPTRKGKSDQKQPLGLFRI
jgi:hypothetical protein